MVDLKYIVHDEKDVLAVAICLALSVDKIWGELSDVDQATYRLEAWEFLDYMYVLHWRKVEAMKDEPRTETKPIVHNPVTNNDYPVVEKLTGVKVESMWTKPAADGLLTEFIACELFAIWKEAKESSGDSWSDMTFEELPEKHKHEYYLTANRILAKPKAKWQEQIEAALTAAKLNQLEANEFIWAEHQKEKEEFVKKIREFGVDRVYQEEFDTLIAEFLKEK